MDFKRMSTISFFTFAVMMYGSALVAAEDDTVNIESQQETLLEITNHLEDTNQLAQQDIAQQDTVQQQEDNAVENSNQQIQEENIRDGFFGLLTFIELIHDADKVAREVDRFLDEYGVTPMTKIRDFAGADSPKISLLRLVTHVARIDGQEGKFALLQELLKKGGNPFIIEDGERFSLAQENALSAVQLCHCDHTGYLGIYEYETASEKIKAKARKRHGTLCKNAKRIQELFEEYEPLNNCCSK